MTFRKLAFGALLAAAASGATAQQAQPGRPAATLIAVPPFSAPNEAKVEGAGTTLNIAWDATRLIATDLASTAEIYPVGPEQKDFYSYPEVTAPSFPRWRAKGVKALVTGFVQARSDGRLTFGCYVYDVERGRELGRTGFAVAADDWRRAAHRCSGLAYKSITGSPGIFDTRIAYVAESGSGPGRVKRVAVMDSDGNNQNYLTKGDTFVVSPRLSPRGGQLAYVSYSGGLPHIEVADLDSGSQRPLVPTPDMTFAPAFSADGDRIAFSMMQGGNSEIYVVDSSGGLPQRVSFSPGIDTAPSFSPDGRKIVFESDRSGSSQLYIMNANGSDVRRLTFGGAWYSAPEWSPDGKWIAFTRRASDGRRIGIIGADGTGERVLSSGPHDEGGRWAPSSRELVFQRTGADGRNGLYRVTIDGEQPRSVVTPQDGSDPDWSGVVE